MDEKNIEKDIEGIVKVASKLAPGRGLDVASSASLVRDAIEGYYSSRSATAAGDADLNQLVQEASRTGASFLYEWGMPMDYHFKDKKGFRKDEESQERAILKKLNPEGGEGRCMLVWLLGTGSRGTIINEALTLRPLHEPLSDIADNGTEEPACILLYQVRAYGSGREGDHKYLGLVTSEQKAKRIASTAVEHPEQVKDAFENLPCSEGGRVIQRNGRILISSMDEIRNIMPQLDDLKRRDMSKSSNQGYVQEFEQAGLVKTYQAPSE